MVKKIIVATSGYFDPIHVGHIEYLKKAKALGDKLIVILNSDKQAILKKGYSFMPQAERRKILESLRFVDEVVESIDDDKSICKTLSLVRPDIFAKGGDRTVGEIPETPVCRELNIKIVDGLGEKIQSSSELVKRSKELNLKK